MKLQCTDSACLARNSGPVSRPLVRKGRFFRKSDGQWISRFRCPNCGRGLSSARLSPCFGQKKRKLNCEVKKLLNSGVSQRRAAWILGVNPKTVVRKFRFLASQARLEHEAWLKEIPLGSIEELQFDDLETSEHTKCKPLSVTLAVVPKTRKILSFQISSMPAKGPLASIARRRYGQRADERGANLNELFSVLKPYCAPNVTWRSDQNPNYSAPLKAHYPDAAHIRHKGRRARIAGQGELKVGGYDPLFSLNHTCAMFRANLNRLFRRTWCTTKNKQGLIDHLSLYVAFHNRVLTPSGTA